MSDLRKYFDQNNKRLIDKYLHYFDIYERHFSRFRNTEVHFMEIGIFHGGSLQMWKDYFGPKATIYGVDINPACKNFEEPQVSVFIGDQSDRTFLRTLARQVPRIDILLDDGGHFMDQQIITFEELYPYVDANGVYVCEDLHTSYYSAYGGGFKARGTYIEYSKYFIDYLNAWHDPKILTPEVEKFTKSTRSLHYYDSVLVVEKRPVAKCERRLSGTPSFPKGPELSFWGKVQERFPQLVSIVKHKLLYRPLHRR